jgi:hypothetical protein
VSTLELDGFRACLEAGLGMETGEEVLICVNVVAVGFVECVCEASECDGELEEIDVLACVVDWVDESFDLDDFGVVDVDVDVDVEDGILEFSFDFAAAAACVINLLARCSRI